MRKTSVSSNSFGGFLSPGAPNYSDNKGWSSERVPHPPANSTAVTRRHIGSSSALTTPFYSGRSIPSKWEDAERWICSPVSMYPQGVCKNSSVSSEQRRQKSKSGPIVPPPALLPHPPPPSSSSATLGGGCYHYSPRMRSMDGGVSQGSMKSLMVVGSPFSTGVLEADRVFRGRVGGGGGGGGGCGHGHSRSWVDLMSEETSSLSSKTDTEEKAEDTKEEEEMTTAMQSPVVSRRDMATQMSPEEDNNQSPPLVVSVIEPPLREEARGSEVREVKMDKGARMIKRPKRRVIMSTRVIRREQPEVEDNSDSSSWDISEPAMNLSK